MEIDYFNRNSTVRWSCRKDDIILWFSYKGIRGDAKNNLELKDIWSLKDGDFLTITNRFEDIPQWFEFYPFEVKSSFAYKLLPEFNKGNYAKEPIDGPNIWRPKSGDYLVWLRTSTIDDPENAIKSSISFKECSLVIGENTNKNSESFGDFVHFGELLPDNKYDNKLKLSRMVFDKLTELGLPRVFSPIWKIG